MRKVVLVTGSSKGIGAACIKKFASNNYDVVITYKDDLDGAKLVEEEISKYGVKSLIVKCDLASEEDINNLIESVINVYGTIDVLVNNVGVEESSDFFDKSKESFDIIFNVNVTGTFLLTKKVV